jgi:RNA polymerase sigma factor (sigma-70 family)
MARERLHSVLHHLQRLTGGGSTVPDADLLARFVARRDEAAFELLLWRHGPMVQGVCRRLLANAADVEDAFQAAFLALVRKAASIASGQSVAGWLYRVAYRVALRLRAAAARQPSPAPDLDPAAPADPTWSDLRPVLDEEVNRLPEKYRLPIVLCYFQGRTHEEAARELGCPRNTVSIRLLRARERLRARLASRGLALSAATLVLVLTERVASATVAVALVEAAASAGMAWATGRAAAGAVSPRAAALAEGVLKAMFASKLKYLAAVLCLALGVLGGGTWAILGRATGGAEGIVPRPAVADEDPTLIKLPSAVSGILVLVGTEVKEGEKVPAEDAVTLKVGKEERVCRRLKVGDTVEAEQLLARVDDRVARNEVAVKEARLQVSEADLRAAVKTKEEAKKRYDVLLKALAARAVAQEEVDAAKLTWDRYVEEENAKRAQVTQAQRELETAQVLLSMHEVRSPVRGVVKAIYKQRGEGVKALEPVVGIRQQEKGAAAPVERPRPARVEVPSEREGVLVLVGSEIKEGEKVPPEDTVTLKVGNEKKTYRRLAEGDLVEEGQLLAKVDDRLARADLAVKQARIDAAEADLRAAAKTREEALKRLESLQVQERRLKGTVIPEDLRAAQLAADRYAEEENARKAALTQARIELAAAQVVVEMHEVRSPVRGVVKVIYKQRGEGVKALEPMLQMQIVK